MARPPHEQALDSTAALLADPYDFIRKRCERHASPVFAARLLGQDTLCLSGAEAAALFYDPQRFQREGAAPEPLRATLFGKGGVQGLDGDMHRARKALFMDLMSPASIARLVRHARNEWDGALRRWTVRQEFALYDALHPMLMRAACAWAGVPLPAAELASRTDDVVALFDAAGRVGPAHLRARLARGRCEEWLAGLVEQVRTEFNEQGAMREATALQAVALHRDADGELLKPRVAAVELLNLIRPTVAVSVYIVFCAHALEVHPPCRDWLKLGERDRIDCFVQEVRRWYPFFPATAARVREDFTWQGIEFRAGQRVLLDLYGTNQDPLRWPEPERFDPQRFQGRAIDPFEMIPQGGGEHRAGHRCPGEWIAIELMALAVDYLVNRLRYRVPQQDLWLDKTRLPALPRSRMLICDVTMAGAAAPADQ